MMFKSINPKLDQSNENTTQVKTNIERREERKSIKSLKWLSCFLTLALIITTCVIIIPVLIWNDTMSDENNINRKCHHKYQNGICLTNSYCCDGEYIISADLCSGNGLCCLGKVGRCKAPFSNETELWSFSSLTEISSQIVCRNVSEPVVEQAIVFSVSAIEDYEFFYEISEKVGQELSYATGHRWYSIVGQKQSFDIFLKQFEAYILITVSEIEIMLFRIDLPNTNSVDSNKIEYNFGVDTRPTINVLRNQMNETMSSFVKQTLDYILSSCFNKYRCVSLSIVYELNQQFGDGWQCIISSSTNELVADINYINGTLLEVNYNNKHRIIVYKAVVMKKITDTSIEIIENARNAISTNSTVIVENYLDYANTSEALHNIYLAVMDSIQFWPICHRLTSLYSQKYQNDWGCVAGVHQYFSHSIAWSVNSYIEVKLHDLNVILFERN